MTASIADTNEVPALAHARMRLALLGLGRMGLVHATAIKRMLPEVDLAVVAEQRLEVVVDAADLIGDAVVYPDASAALAHEGLDACLIVTPTDTHVEQVEAAIEHGLHIFCEKPLTLDPADSLRLGAAARERGLVLQVGFWRRFLPPLVELRRHLRDGSVGRAVFVRSSQWDAVAPAPSWCAPERSGGIFVDMGVHDLDEVEWLLDDKIVELEGRAFPIADPAIGDAGDLDNAAILLRFASGATGLIDLTRNARYADDLRIELLGSDGAMFVDTLPRAQLRLGDRNGLETVWQGKGPDTFLDGIAAEIAAFSRVVADPESERVPGALESARATYLGAAARHSASSGRPLADIPDDFS